MNDLINLLKIKCFLDFFGWVRSNFGGSQESHLINNHIEFIDYFSIRFSEMPPIVPPHVFP